MIDEIGIVKIPTITLIMPKLSYTDMH